MPAVRFSLSPQHCARLYDTLQCLAKFSEVVRIEARYGQLLLSALNSSKSAYALFVLSRTEFFTNYEFDVDANLAYDRFSCGMLNRSLASVFKGRLGDSRAGEGGIESAVAEFERGSIGEESRIVIRMLYSQGITKTFRLTYEASPGMLDALFDKDRNRNIWKAPARMLREIAEYLGPRTEFLSIGVESEQVTLTSYTEKLMHGKEIIKQPLQSSISLDTSDFDVFDVEDELSIGIMIKDFRSIIAHADTLRSTVTAMYSDQGLPVQFSYSGEGMRCEFTVQTLASGRGSDAISARAVTREAQSQPATRTTTPAVDTAAKSKTSVAAAARSRLHRPQLGQLGRRQPDQSMLPSQSAAPLEQQSLFVPLDNEDDALWQPVGERHAEDDRDVLGWDASDQHAHTSGTFRDRGPQSAAGVDQPILDHAIPPTQRASEYRGLFD